MWPNNLIEPYVQERVQEKLGCSLVAIGECGMVELVFAAQQLIAEDIDAVPVDGLPSHKNLVTAFLHKRMYRRTAKESLPPNPEIPTETIIYM